MNGQRALPPPSSLSPPPPSNARREVIALFLKLI